MDYVGDPEDQQRLLFGRNIMENDNIFELYNVKDHSILMVVRILRGWPRTRCIRGLTSALIDEMVSEKKSDISTSEISDTSESLFADTSEEDLDYSEDGIMSTIFTIQLNTEVILALHFWLHYLYMILHKLTSILNLLMLVYIYLFHIFFKFNKISTIIVWINIEQGSW